MRRIVVITGVVVALSVAAPRPAKAIFCENCSTIWEQLIEAATQVEQLAAEVQTQINTLNAYINLVQNTVSIPQVLYRDIRGHIDQITDLAKRATMNGGYTGTMLSNLASGTYPIQGAATYATLIAEQSKAVALALKNAGTVIDRQDDQLRDSASTLTSIHNQATSLDSRNGILQSLAGTTAATGQLVVTQQAAVGSAMQALMTDATARADRESYVVSLTDAYEKAGIKAACNQIRGALVVPACQ
jgi:P-type conjugative transfer protein TrbJ